MGRLSERLDVALRALGTLDELARKSTLTAVERDALLQRFEYSLEAVWKAAQRFLSEVEGIDVARRTPRSAHPCAWLCSTSRRRVTRWSWSTIAT